MTDIFNEDSLRDAIISVWGEHGAHVEVYDKLIEKIEFLSNDLAVAQDDIAELHSELIMAQDEACEYAIEVAALEADLYGYH